LNLETWPGIEFKHLAVWWRLQLVEHKKTFVNFSILDLSL